VTRPVYTAQYCAVCGRQVGKRAGVEVVLGLLCNSPLCHLQAPTSPTLRRDQLLTFAVFSGIPVTSVAKYAGISRQRVYQIIESERAGV
jgi:hypothetical protein